MKKKGRQKKKQIRLGPDYAMLMFNKYFERLKESKKKYSRKRKHRKAGANVE